MAQQLVQLSFELKSYAIRLSVEFEGIFNANPIVKSIASSSSRASFRSLRYDVSCYGGKNLKYSR